MADPIAPDTTPVAPRVGWHITGSVAAWALPLVISILAMPFLWRTLGRDGYGVYVLAVAYGALAGSFGSVRGTAQRVSTAAASSPDHLAAALGGAYLAAFASGAVTIVAATLLAPAFVRLAGIDPEAALGTLRAFQLAGAAAPAMHLIQATRGMLVGLERYGAYSTHVTATAVMTTTGVVFLAARGHQAPDLMLWLIVTNMVSAAAGVALAQHATGARPAWSWAEAWVIARFGATLIATDTILSLYVLAERMLLTRAMGVGVVAEYTIPLSVANALQNAMAAGAVVLLPRAGAAWVRRDATALRRMYARSIKAIALVAVGGSTAVAGAAATLVGWWIDPDFGRQTAGVVAVLLAANVVNAMSTPLWYLSEGAGMPGRNTAFSAGVAVVGIGAAVVLAPLHGTLGVAWARCLSVLSVLVFVWLGERRVLGAGQRALWRAMAMRLVPAGLALAATVFLAQRALAGLPLLAANGLLLGAYIAWVWRSAYFDAADREAIRRLIDPRRQPVAPVQG